MRVGCGECLIRLRDTRFIIAMRRLIFSSGAAHSAGDILGAAYISTLFFTSLSQQAASPHRLIFSLFSRHSRLNYITRFTARRDGLFTNRHSKHASLGTIPHLHFIAYFAISRVMNISLAPLFLLPRLSASGWRRGGVDSRLRTTTACSGGGDGRGSSSN